MLDSKLVKTRKTLEKKYKNVMTLKYVKIQGKFKEIVKIEPKTLQRRKQKLKIKFVKIVN